MQSRRSRGGRRSQSPAPTDTPDRDERRDDGSFAAMDQIANWVRFADTKSAILTAAMGVVLTSFLSNANRLVVTMKDGQRCAWLVAALVLVTLAAFVYTLAWLLRSLAPRRQTAQSGINRFSWPTLRSASVAGLMDHVDEVDARIDAWRQVVDLSAVANEKFKAFDRALRGFAIFALLVVVLVGVGIALVP